MTLCGTRSALAVWKPAPSHASTACTPGASDAELPDISCIRSKYGEPEDALWSDDGE